MAGNSDVFESCDKNMQTIKIPLRMADNSKLSKSR